MADPSTTGSSWEPTNECSTRRLRAAGSGALRRHAQGRAQAGEDREADAFKTTKGYIDLAGETFREEAELAKERMLGQKSGQK
jgi:hypothetical protein